MSTSIQTRDPKARRSEWAREKTLRLLTLIALLVLVSIAASTIYPLKATALMSHPPISIFGNTEFTTANGVTGGNGSTSNPYIIEGWDIAAPASTDGIDVQQTNASLIIRNVNIHGGNVGSNGIFLSQVTNVVIRDTMISNLNNGISTFLSNATIENSKIFYNGLYGVSILDGENVNLFNNTITLNMGDGIHSNNYCINCLLNVTGNTITTNLSGIILKSENNSFISRNNILTNTDDGIGVYKSTFVLIDLNNITSNAVGVDLGGSTNSLVHHNNFLNNIVHQALDNETGKNMWDVGYASGGNYWSNYTGVDHCSGPAQNVCTKSDGIGDIPYLFVNGQDRYPLQQLFVQTVIHDVAVSSITPSATSVNQSETLSVTVLVANEGAATENFTLTLYYDNTLIGSQTIPPLDPGVYQTVLFNWNTTGVPAGLYTLKATASTVWGEIDVADNTLVSGPVEVKIPPSTAPTPPSSPPTTQPSTSSSYLAEGIAALLIVSIFAVLIRRTRRRTR